MTPYTLNTVYILQRKIAHNYLLIEYLEDVKSVLRIFELKSGKHVAEIPIPIGAVSSLSCRRESSELFFKFTSFITPSTIYRLDLVDFSNTIPSIFRDTNSGIDSDHFETRQVFYTSKDGTKVPMFITSRKGLELNSESPAILHAYGSHGNIKMPQYSSLRLPWLANFNGIFCVANVRGGGEYGQDWHYSGRRAKKQNTYNDFISAAEYLVTEGYTSKEKLAIMGGSSGGLLVGACLNQRPDLFSAGVPKCGTMDILRFHRYTIGHAWVAEYGCSDNKDDFDHLIKISPMHNVPENRNFPAVLVTTADHDDRVVPHHTLKYLATIQDKLRETNRPIMGRIATKTGHGFGKSTEMVRK